MVREHAAEQAPASGQQGGTGEGGAVHEAPTAVGVGGGAVALTINTGMIGVSYGQFKFGVEHISVTPLLEGRHDLTAWVSAIRPQLQCADLLQFCNGKAPSPAPNNPLQQREYVKGQMLAFMVLNRRVSPPIRMSISGFSQQEKARQLAWAYVSSTYQARDALHASLLQNQLAQLRKGDDETAESYYNRARTIRAELLTIGQEVHMATFSAHVVKGLPPEYGFLCRKLDISSPDMTVEHVCSKVLMEEQTLSIEQSYKQITSDASAFSGTVNTIVATKGARPVRDLPAPCSFALLSLTWLLLLHALLLQPSRPSRAPPAVRTACFPARPCVLPAAKRAAAFTRVHTRPLRAAAVAALLLSATAAAERDCCCCCHFCSFYCCMH
ncbi:unnamed protein product [Closterium sp. NIES-54]